LFDTQNSSGLKPRYNDRMHAGYELAVDLRRFVAGGNPIILGIPRGGVPVSAATAEDLGAPLDILVPRRIEAPGRPELTLGAITPDRTLVVHRTLVESMGITDAQLEQLSLPVWAEVQRTQQLYRGGRPLPDLRGRLIVLVDDRLTTGYTMMAAVVSARKFEPERVMVAVPVASLEGMERISDFADEVLALEIAPDISFPAQQYYASWTTLSDREVQWTLERAWTERPPTGWTETF
jgi:predicted phosphoribosyltransferase